MGIYVHCRVNRPPVSRVELIIIKEKKNIRNVYNFILNTISTIEMKGLLWGAKVICSIDVDLM